MLKKEFDYYIKNQDDLVKKYEGKYLVIKDENVAGVYEDKATAYNESIRIFKLGTFLIQKCLSGEDSYTQKFTSRVINNCIWNIEQQ